MCSLFPPAVFVRYDEESTFFLQILPFILIHKPLFRLYPTEAIIVKSASIISNVVRGSALGPEKGLLGPDVASEQR